jgi:hypothetical protein
MLMWRFLFLFIVSGLAQAQDAGALRARHAALEDELAGNPFGRALHVVSRAEGGNHKGEIYAVIDEPYRAVASALVRPGTWCEVLVLQVNVKRCDAGGGKVLAAITQKPRDSAESAHRVEFGFAGAATLDYLQVALTAPEGPVGTRDYDIRLEAVPLDGRRTFIHLSYAYTLGWMARLAMNAYLAGAGSGKYGFSVVERRADGSPVYVDGVRGVIERGAMRYFLAVEAYLAAPSAQRLEARLRDWYAQTSRYPQLRESVGAEEYVAMKKREAG